MRGDHQLIPANAPDEEALHHRVRDAVSCATIRATSPCSTAKETPYADGIARTTSSNGTPLASTFGNSSHRTNVRSRRFTRFRSTEL
jgi:hypothetical protein